MSDISFWYLLNGDPTYRIVPPNPGSSPIRSELIRELGTHLGRPHINQHQCLLTLGAPLSDGRSVVYITVPT